jgi:hypothetical protein
VQSRAPQRHGNFGLAKVRVEGSNPFARSKCSHDLSRSIVSVFSFLNDEDPGLHGVLGRAAAIRDAAQRPTMRFVREERGQSTPSAAASRTLPDQISSSGQMGRRMRR